MSQKPTNMGIAGVEPRHLSIAFFLSSFDHGTFEEVATVVYALYVVVLS
jgi:hypothetical protein